jgi:hypothetical protein
MEDWNDGMMERWKYGRLEYGSVEAVEAWKQGAEGN